MVTNNKCFDVDEARELISDHRYIIDEFVGAGAMACVYKVRERGTPNVYALKLLREQYRQREQFKEIFEREATHMRDLQYPNIVRFYKFVLEERSAYILMDYVEGKPLTYYIQQARKTEIPIAIDKIVRIMAQIARAINYLHTEGFIHRDVKPGNVLLVGKDESAFLTDLGIAGASDEPTLSGAGTPSYMPYEQQTSSDVDHTVDIYAFAVMLFELFTGQKPFSPAPGLTFNEARKAIVELHRKEAVPSISAMRTDLPKEIDKFFEQALAKDSSDRYKDILDFAQDIHEVLLPGLPKDLQDFDNIQAQEIERSAETKVVEVQVPADRRGVIFGGIAAIVGIILLVLVAISLNNLGTNSTNDDGEGTPPNLTSENATSASLVPTSVLDDTTVFELAEGIDALGYGENINSSARYIASVREGLVPLRFGDDVNAFRVDLHLRDSSLSPSQQYGVAFRIQDDNNYLLFSVDGAASAWTLSAIENGVMRGLQTGTLDALPSELIVSAENEFLRIEVGDMPIQQTYADWQSGAVALWLPFNEDIEPVTISSLSISLIGTDATLAQDFELSDLPIIAPLQFLSEDVEALRATGDDNAIVNCSQFMTIYERLENHLIIEGATDFVAQARAISTVIFNRCQLERESNAVEFTFSDYLNWEQGLSELVSEIQAAQ